MRSTYYFVAFLATGAVTAAPAKAAQPVYAIRELKGVTIYPLFTPPKASNGVNRCSST
jgi:hypothetical protein